MWWISREGAKLYVYVNGRRAFSRNSNTEFAHLVAVTALDDAGIANKIMFRFACGYSTAAKMEQMDAGICCQALFCKKEELRTAASLVDAVDMLLAGPSESSIESILTTDSSPDSEPPIKRMRQKPQRKAKCQRTCSKLSISSSDDSDPPIPPSLGDLDQAISAKCKGSYEVSLSSLFGANRDLQRPRSRKEVIAAKRHLEKIDIRQVHIFPVLSDGQSSEPTSGRLQVLGGPPCAYVEAAKELVDDTRFSHLKDGWRVQLYIQLTDFEALRVGSLYQESRPVASAMCFQDQVELCRKILYWHNALDWEEEPVRMLQDVRKKCSLALGKETSKNALRSLEPTFQAASYSCRCYRKAMVVFNNYREQTGKELSQFSFMKLQGLPEEVRYDLLVTAASDGNMKAMWKNAEAVKTERVLQDHFVQLVGAESWAEARELYPDHTSEEAMKPYVGLKIKRNQVPDCFTAHSLNARQTKVMGVPALFMSSSVQTTQIMKSPIAKASVFVCGDVTAAAKAVTALEETQTITVINEDTTEIEDNQSSAAVQFAVVVSGKPIKQTVLFVKDHNELSRFFIHSLTNEGDTVLDDMNNNGDLARQATSLMRYGKIFREESEESNGTEEGETEEGETEQRETEEGETEQRETEEGETEQQETEEGVDNITEITDSELLGMDEYSFGE